MCLFVMLVACTDRAPVAQAGRSASAQEVARATAPLRPDASGNCTVDATDSYYKHVHLHRFTDDGRAVFVTNIAGRHLLVDLDSGEAAVRPGELPEKDGTEPAGLSWRAGWACEGQRRILKLAPIGKDGQKSFYFPRRPRRAGPQPLWRSHDGKALVRWDVAVYQDIDIHDAESWFHAWDSASGEYLSTLHIRSGIYGPTEPHMRIGPLQDHLTLFFGTGTTMFWRYRARQLLDPAEGMVFPVACTGWNYPDDALAMGHPYVALLPEVLLDLQRRTCVRIVTELNHFDMVIMRDAAHLAIVSASMSTASMMGPRWGAKLSLWSVPGVGLRASWSLPKADVWPLVSSRDGRYLAFTDDKLALLTLVETRSRQMVYVAPVCVDNRFYAVAFTPRGHVDGPSVAVDALRFRRIGDPTCTVKGEDVSCPRVGIADLERQRGVSLRVKGLLRDFVAGRPIPGGGSDDPPTLGQPFKVVHVPAPSGSAP